MPNVKGSSCFVGPLTRRFYTPHDPGRAPFNTAFLHPLSVGLPGAGLDFRPTTLPIFPDFPRGRPVTVPNLQDGKSTFVSSETDRIRPMMMTFKPLLLGHEGELDWSRARRAGTSEQWRRRRRRRRRRGAAASEAAFPGCVRPSDGRGARTRRGERFEKYQRKSFIRSRS